MQITFAGEVPGQANTMGTAQAKSSAALFASMLASLLGESAGSIGDFTEDGGAADVLGQGSVFGGSQGISDGMGGMLALMFAGMLLGGGGMGTQLFSALLGGGSRQLLYDPSCGAENADAGTKDAPARPAAPLQAAGLLAYANQAGNTAIPANAWIAVNPLVVSHVGGRDPGLYREVISQFNVETNERYRVNKQGIGDTYCNIFAWDISRAMGAEIPHYINAATGEPAAAGEAGAVELDANAVNDWLNKYGKQYGWTEVSAEQAQAYANAGMPAVTSWKNPGGHGHMQVVSPSENNTYDPARGVAIAQAGRHLYSYNYITAVYGQNTLGKVQYFAHI